MSTGTLRLTAPAAARPGPGTRLLRWALFRKLEGIRGGAIAIADGDAVRTFGEVTGPDMLTARVTVRDPSFYRRVAFGGSLGVAEAYMDGLWSTDDLPALLRIFARNIDVARRMRRGPARLAAPAARLYHRLRKNTRAGSKRNIEAHYDLGNDLFELFLDETMTYSAGIFEREDSTLREASIAKLDRLCRKLELGPDDHVLEIGSGWGSFAVHAAKTYGCHVTTTTISKEQHRLAAERVREAGLDHRVTVLLSDYRDLEGEYDRLVSIEMIEAVGHEFLGDYFAKCASLLRPGGRMAIQAIVMPDRGYDRYLRSVDFIQRYVFPGSCLPSLGSMVNAVEERTDLALQSLEEIGPHYARTLAAWRRRFLGALDRVRALGYPVRFARMWDYYLAYCEAGFAERRIGDLQLVWERAR